MRSRRSGDDGVVAVVTALLVAFVLLPVAALGLTAYTRSGVAEEMQRAADSGALAGAASLALLDVGSTLGSPTSLATLPPGLPTLLGSSGLACTAARRAYGLAGADDPARTPTRNSPLSVGFASTPTCGASYTPDPALGSCLTTITSQLDTLVGPLVNRLLAFQNALSASADITTPAVTVGTVVVTPAVTVNLGTDVLPKVADLDDVAQAVLRLVPAVAHNGIRVDLGYTVRGPLDGVLPGQGTTASTTTASARRLFKPLLPALPALQAAIGTDADTTLQAGPLTALVTVSGGLSPSLTPVERLVVGALQTQLQALKLLTRAGGATVSEVANYKTYLDNAFQVAQASATAQIGPVSAAVSVVLTPLLTSLGAAAPAVPVVPALSAACLPAVDDLLDDLSDALRVRNDTDPSPVDCLVQRVLARQDPPSALAPVASDCVNRLFRAQLAR